MKQHTSINAEIPNTLAPLSSQKSDSHIFILQTRDQKALSWESDQPKKSQERVCVCACMRTCVCVCARAHACVSTHVHSLAHVRIQSCPALCKPLNCSPSGSSVLGIFQQYWSRLPFPTPGDLLNPGIERASVVSPALAGRFFSNGTTQEAQLQEVFLKSSLH